MDSSVEDINKIELKIFKRSKSRIFTGRPAGENARKKLDLDEFDKNDKCVEIIIPDDTLSVNSSFFSGMFQKSLKDLGEDKFRKKYVFRCAKEIIIKVNIENDIKVCLALLKTQMEE